MRFIRLYEWQGVCSVVVMCRDNGQSIHSSLSAYLTKASWCWLCPISDLRAGSVVVVDVGTAIWGQTKHRAATESIQVSVYLARAVLPITRALGRGPCQ